MTAPHVMFFGLLFVSVTFAIWQDKHNSAHIWELLSSDENGTATDLDRFNGIVCLLGVYMDYFILNQHYNKPHHPKFYRTTTDKVALAIHVICGTIEMFGCYLSLFQADPSTAAKVAAWAAVLGHVPTSFYLTPGVLASKRVAIPCYVGCNLFHGFSAIQVLRDPNDLYKLLLLNIVMHTYGWLRMNLFLFNKFRIFQEHRYSVALVVSGFLSLSCFSNPVPVWSFWFYIGMSNYIWSAAADYLVPRYPSMAWLSEEVDNDRGLALFKMSAVRSVLEDAVTTAMEEIPDEDFARTVFEAYADEETGTKDRLSVPEVTKMVYVMGKSTSVTQEFVAEHDSVGDGFLHFADFYDKIWSDDLSKRHLIADYSMFSCEAVPGPDAPDFEIARFIFNMLDFDKNGTISTGEFAALLKTWGILDCDRVAKDSINEKDMTFEVFYEKERILWEHCYEHMIWDYETLKQDRERASQRTSFTGLNEKEEQLFSVQEVESVLQTVSDCCEEATKHWIDGQCMALDLTDSTDDETVDSTDEEEIAALRELFENDNIWEYCYDHMM